MSNDVQLVQVLLFFSPIVDEREQGATYYFGRTRPIMGSSNDPVASLGGATSTAVKVPLDWDTSGEAKANIAWNCAASEVVSKVIQTVQRMYPRSIFQGILDQNGHLALADDEGKLLKQESLPPRGRKIPEPVTSGILPHDRRVLTTRMGEPVEPDNDSARVISLKNLVRFSAPRRRQKTFG